MSSTTVNGFLATAITTVSDVISTNIPLALAIGAGLLAVFVGWRIVKRFVSGR